MDHGNCGGVKQNALYMSQTQPTMLAFYSVPSELFLESLIRADLTGTEGMTVELAATAQRGRV